MTEINNFPNFGINKVGTQNVNPEEKPETQVTKAEEKPIVPDTGVLGRSQVDYKGGNMQASIDEALALIEQNPEVVAACDNLFDKTYEDLKNKGMDPTDAYFAASEIAGQTAELATNI